MKPYDKVSILFSIIILSGAFLFAAGAQAQVEMPSDEDIIQGALLYDKWYADLGVNSPEEENPLWDRQTTNTRSGPDTWRCVECHGWDYKGVDGAYATGSHYTGFPGVKAFADRATQEEIVEHLNGARDPAHDFSPYISNEKLIQLAAFLKFGLIDDDLYIDAVSLKVIGGDIAHGQELYESTCSQCHGEDGKRIVFRQEGVDEYLGTVANRDPWRFLHRTRFGTAGTSMPIGHSFGWIPEDGRDVLAYAQTLPTGFEGAIQSPSGEQAQEAQELGGPAETFWQGILTGLATFLGTIGASILFLSVLLILGVVVVVILRRR
jgi:thiosulfate dehydrogenase